MPATARGRCIWVMSLTAMIAMACGNAVVPPSVIPSPVATAVSQPPKVDLTPSPRPNATPLLPTVTTDPAAPAADSMPVGASVERDGIRVEIRLGLNPLHGGLRTGVETTVINTGDRPLHWTVDGCGVDVAVQGEMDATWRSSSMDVDPALVRYRDWLREAAAVDQPIALGFAPASFGDGGQYGCADVGIPRDLAPGESTRQELMWFGQARGRLGLPPSAPTTITGTFAYWYRGAEQNGAEGEPLTVTLDSWVIDGRPPEFLSPAEVIDAALADEELATWLVAQPFRSRADAVAEYDVQAGIWLVGLQIYRDVGPGPSLVVLHAALVDPVSGEVIAIREHPVQFD